VIKIEGGWRKRGRYVVQAAGNNQRTILPAYPEREEVFSLPYIIYDQQNPLIPQHSRELSADFFDLARSSRFVEFERIRPGGKLAQDAGVFA
jgi:hypothetical protein